MKQIVGKILVVDDHKTNQLKMSMAARNLGHTTDTALDGVEAMEKMREQSFDLILLDILMPNMDGFDVLAAMKEDEALDDIPVIVISALDELEEVAHAIELGAEEFLPKSFDLTVFKARVNACLEKKQLRDKTKQQLEITRELFGKFVPERVAESILQGRGHLKPVSAVATVMFTDVQGFTAISENRSPKEIVEILSEYFDALKEPINKYGGVINQFQGDATMVIYNIPVEDPNHADSAIETALEIQAIASGHTFCGVALPTRIGICTGEVIAGNIGSGERLHYTVYGDTVNSAARLEKLNKEYGTSIMVAKRTMELASKNYGFAPRGEMDIRGHSPIETYSIGGLDS